MRIPSGAIINLYYKIIIEDINNEVTSVNLIYICGNWDMTFGPYICTEE